MARSNLELHEEVLKKLLENLKEEVILENCRHHSNQCFYLKESIKIYKKIWEKETDIIDSREGNTLSMPILEMFTASLVI